MENASRTEGIFREYLRQIPDELLQQLIGEYAWLATEINMQFAWRWRACQQECAQRGMREAA